jgi:hypothetical protein
MIPTLSFRNVKVRLLSAQYMGEKAMGCSAITHCCSQKQSLNKTNAFVFVESDLAI